MRFAKLCVTTKRPVSDRGALRTLWENAVLGDAAKLDFVPWPVAVIEDRQFQVLFGSSPMESALDTRFRPVGEFLGDGFVGFSEGIPQLARDPSLSAPNGIACAKVCVDLVEQLGRRDEARGEFARAAAMTDNGKQRARLMARTRG